jgi:hypothetical protein
MLHSLTAGNLRIYSKYQDCCHFHLQYIDFLPQGIIFASHNVLDDSSTDFLLLKCIRSKAVLSMYIGLKVQTEDTIAEGQEELLRFSLFMEVGTCNQVLAHS